MPHSGDPRVFADSMEAFNKLADLVDKESARAKIRVMVRRILRKHGYPPDLQEAATKLVLEQAEVLCDEWAT